MTAASPDGSCSSDHEGVREQLARILKSDLFLQSRRRQRFLQYLVDETLAGHGDRLKGYTIAVAVFDRPASFDPAIDPIVRIEAGRLRDKLREYYDTVGRTDPIRIDLPKGSYMPHIETRRTSELSPASGSRDPVVGPHPATESPTHAARAPLMAPLGWRPFALLAAVVGLIATTMLWASRDATIAPPHPDRPSIAVLPFDNIGDEARWERLATGITEDIIADLAHARDLVVIARNSTEVYKDKPVDIRQVGRDLRVKYVLEGSIQAIGERIRVTAQLIEAASGSHVWIERYDRPADDLFAVQNEVTQRIAATLIGYQGAVAQAERSLLRRKPPASLSAYETYLLAIEAKHRVTKESLIEAEALFRKAIEIDPQLARAYSGLATVQYYLIDLGLTPSVEEAVRKMSEAAEQALKLDPNDGLSHQVLGMAYGYQGKPTQSLAEFNRAEALAPSDADLLLIVAWSLPTLGEPARAARLADQALKLNPRYPDWYNQGLSFIYFFDAQHDKSVQYRLLVKNPLALDHAFLAMAYAQQGLAGEAAAAAANVVKLDADWNAERYLSEAGGYAEPQAEIFVASARKAGLPDCLPSGKLQNLPNAFRVRSCDTRRAKLAG